MSRRPVATMADDNTVLIGKKPTLTYVLAVLSLFQGGSPEVVVKARGRSISRAVDVAEIVRGRFVPNAKVREVRIGTERVPSDEGRPASVSAIEIVLAM